MKLVTFSHNQKTGIGALVSRDGSEFIVDFSAADANLPSRMKALLKGGEAALESARKAVDKAPAGALIARDAVTLHAPIRRPGKIMCIGLNYADHAAEAGQPLPEFPTLFSKYSNAVIGYGDTIVLPKVSDRVDYEAELVVVIGKRARHVSASEAMQYVAGYMNGNDVSARDYQNRTSQWTSGKTFDTFAPTGPALVTADEIPNPATLRISLRIGDEAMQDSSTKELIFGIPALVESLSEIMTLDPGDIIFTGTPPGVGVARDPQRFLRAGDVVHVEIEGLGTLTNSVSAES